MAERRPLVPDDVLLTDRRAVVTGAAAGIGRAIAAAYARFGAHVAVCDRDESGLAGVAEEIEALGRRSPRGVLDVRDVDSVVEWVNEVASALGGIDVLVNNAGGGFAASFLDLSSKGEDALVRENFVSVTGFVRAAVPHMAHGGAIVNITSIEAHRAGPGFAVYSAMKAAVASLTKSLALELGDRRIRVNCVAPDVIPTPGIGIDIPVRTPLPEAGHVDDVAGAAVYLASDLARFVTGTTVHVDGGNLAAAGWNRSKNGDWVTGAG